jgi:hypothetical protein
LKSAPAETDKTTINALRRHKEGESRQSEEKRRQIERENNRWRGGRKNNRKNDS